MIHETRGPGYFMMQDLERQYAQLAGRSGTLRLWIASSDPTIDPAMRRVSDSQLSLILRVPTEHLMKDPVEGAPILKVLDFSIDRFKLRGIVVCGHASEEVSRPAWKAEKQDFGASAGNKLLQGAQARMAKNRWWKRRTLNYAESLRKTSPLSVRLKRDALDFRTVYYLKETGVFSVFNEASENFEPNFGEAMFQ